MLDLEKEIFITLGCGDRFEISKFDKPRNRECFCKPFGGLWSSPENSTWGWRDWCEAENFWIDKINGSSFRFQLKPGSKVYIQLIHRLTLSGYHIKSKRHLVVLDLT